MDEFAKKMAEREATQAKLTRQHYIGEIGRVSAEIKRVYKKIADSEHHLATNPRWRKSIQCKASDVLRLIDTTGFYVLPMPGHCRKQKDEWVQSILRGDSDGLFSASKIRS